ncbi:MAG: V-type ATPase subunit [Candidatus Micrarchaeia archaeon]
MNADLSYAYANARVKASKTKLLSPQNMREILVVRTLNEVIELLEEGPYKEAFVEASVKYSGRKLVLHALSLDFSRQLEKLRKIIPEKDRGALEKLLQKWEVQAVELVLASKAQGAPVSPDELVFIEEGRKRALKNFIDAPSLDAATAELAKAGYGPAVARAKSEYDKTKDYRVFINALDQQCYDDLSKAITQVKDAHAEKLLKAEIDLHNQMIALRMKHSHSKRAGATPHNIEAYFIAGGDYAFAKQLAHAQDYDSALKMMEQRHGIAGAVQASRENDSLTPVEIALERRFVEKTAAAALGSVLCFGAVMGFLYLKQREVLALRAITFATELGLAEDMKRMVFETGGISVA